MTITGLGGGDGAIAAMVLLRIRLGGGPVVLACASLAGLAVYLHRDRKRS